MMLLEMLRVAVPDLSGVYNLVFFAQVNDFLRDELAEFQKNLIGETMRFLGIASLALLTIWIFIKGYLTVSGRSRESMMGLVVDSLRATLIIAAATGFATANSDIYQRATDGLGDVIVGGVSGGNASDLYKDIDRSLAAMNLAIGSIQAVKVEPNTAAEEDQKRNMYFAGFGTGGPAIIAGAMLTMNKLAVALFVGLGPIFIMCLLFDSTKSLFQRWLLYGIGTWFSLAVLYVMVLLAMDLTLAVAAEFWVSGKLFGATGGQGLNNMAIQQGGLGVILTMLLITAPPMAASFFQGTLGHFTWGSAFTMGGGAASGLGPGGQAPGTPGYFPAAQQPARPERLGGYGNTGGAFAYGGTPTYASSGSTNTQLSKPDEIQRRGA